MSWLKKILNYLFGTCSTPLVVEDPIFVEVKEEVVLEVEPVADPMDVLLPTPEMVKTAQEGLALREKHGKGGENIVVLTLAQNIAANHSLSDEDVAQLHVEIQRRSRYSNANQNTMGFINFTMLGGKYTVEWLENV